MFSTLQKLYAGSKGGYTYPTFNVARAGTTENIRRFTEYFRSNHFCAASNHILVKLIELIPIEHGNDVRKYFDSVTDVAYEIANAVGISSPSYRGGVSSKPWLYGQGNTEIPVAINAYTGDALEFNATNGYGFDTLPSVRLLRHSKTTVGLDIPDGHSPTGEEGLVVYLIDIPLLCTQYRAFCLDQLKTNSDSPEGIGHFVARYVLPSMITDHVNIAFFNNLNARLQQIDVNNKVRRLPIGLPNYNEKLRDLSLAVIERMVGYRIGFADMIKTIPLATEYSTLTDLVTLPDTLITKQVSWALFVAQLPIVDFLFTLDGINEGGGNDTHANALKRELRIALQDGVFKQRLSSKLREEIETTAGILLAQ